MKDPVWNRYSQRTPSSHAREFREMPVAYFGHEDSFIRIALHLHHRARGAGVETSPAILCAGWQYGLSHPKRYLTALGDEPVNWAHMLFRDIAMALPPPAFTELWTRDVLSYHQRFPKTLNGEL